ncbi:hypothetical protein TanjilG_02243 [Lupinus angustifolius]|uniref:Uncharacterized protein n=1 Tax=Lupinus angustifolius TaxID=3871 RepID=A0A4P1QQF0_LUPAN|nr:PREDICTED: probable disease resistance protein At4g27220 [Lupinus angustifolius]XP_019425393.1 PREDICTED: probable disease resistance protein At4g27220 [Lupinus angustifolius]OIV92480.1 hypothetical protein TanjilG_02243 [Lupinus angustifolius]
MASGAESFALKVANVVVGQVGNQLGYLITYERNIDNLSVNVEKLEEAKDVIQHSVDDATKKGEDIVRMVKNWLERVDAIVTEAKTFQKADGHAKAECSCGHFPDLWARHKLSKKAKEIAKDILEAINDGNFQRISYEPRLLVGITSSNARGYEALDSRTYIMNKIVQTLMDAEVCKTGVCGMGGVGKSTLVKELAWRAVQDCSFQTVVSVELTESPDVRTIQVKIAECLGMKKFEVDTIDVRASLLRERIRKEKSILIIMDNIWEKIDLIKVGVPFGADHKGCKLFFTSRSSKVLTEQMEVDEKFCYKLDVLSEHESWNLFEKKVGDAVKDSNLRPTAINVVEACRGLPVLIFPVAIALKNKPKPIWDDALKQLTTFDNKDLNATVYSAINLSYDNLANNELKSLFLLLGSFGQTEIWTRYLLIYFWSLNLYEDADCLANARNRLYNLVAELRSACLLLEEENGESVKMHDLVHEVASKIASKDRTIFAVQMHSELKKWPKMDTLRQCYRMFLPDCRIPDLPERLECPELEILVLVSRNNFLKVPDHFFAGTKEMKVLYLGGMDCLPSLPSSLSQLPKLRALYLRECMLDDIALVAELENLEILGFEISEIRELPAVIGKLTRLRLLDLSNVSGLRAIPAKLISSLTHLEELYMVNTFIQWEGKRSRSKSGSQSQSRNASLDELRHLDQLKALEITIQDASVLPKDLDIFGKLDKYRIYIGKGWTRSWNRKISKTLKLDQGNTKNIHLDGGVKLLLNNAEELCLTNLNGVSNDICQLNEEGFPQLMYLEIKNSKNLQYIIDTKQHSCEAFPKLESLVLCNLPKMQKICDGPLPLQSFAELKVVKVKACDRLQNVFSYSTVKTLSKLAEFEISQCKVMSEIIADTDTDIDEIEFPRLHSLTIDCVPSLASFYSKPVTNDIELTSIVESEDDSTIPMPLFDEKISFPNLESLKISSINLVTIWGDQLSERSSIKKLKSLAINGCANLKSLFTSSAARGLVNLQHLSISGCGMLDEIFSTEGLSSNKISVSNDEAAFPNLETLTISHMDSLKSIWNDQSASNSFPKLITLEISFCSRLINVFSPYVLPTQLKTLTLKNLPMLKNIWSTDPPRSSGFQNLCEVKVTECQSLNHIFPLCVAVELKKLEALDVSSCGIEHIVGSDELGEKVPKLDLPQLKTLRFWHLTNLRSFCSEMQTLECPNLKNLDVYDHDMLEIFAMESQDPEDALVDQQPLFSFEKVIQSLEELSISSEDVALICNDEQSDDDFHRVKSLRLQCFDESDEFSSDFLQRFTNLEKLTLFSSAFKSIPDIDLVEANIKLKSIRINSLWNLEHICEQETEMEQILQELETLEVFHCSRLKTVAPSFVQFENLDTLSLYNCASLVTIISSSTARSLARLRRLWIYNCNMLEEILVNDDDAGEIAFTKLEVIELGSLPRLTSFCNGNLKFKFPLLQSLFLIECPMMEIFSQEISRVPLLRYVYVSGNGTKRRWDGDLNSTVSEVFRQSTNPTS